MPGQLDDVKPRKRKSGSSRGSRKASPRGKRWMKTPKTPSAAESSSTDGGFGKPAGALERLSRISCECHQSAGRRRCSASPEREGREGKENELRTGQDSDGCGVNSARDKQEPEHMEYEETAKNLFPDDDSNQILPVEQFFGNLDTVQDFPQRPSETSAGVHRGNRRRHYYAREDSDDEEEASLGGTQRDDGAAQR
ncbi:UPF0688 protein C1orf174 homolog [Brachyistius frenatus]|uniref:UPF0688 protein C1orf174 homolog n=1 Tax=Brachyistius frenatus TaxID=100188 RepID=UPI0037E9207B